METEFDCEFLPDIHQGIYQDLLACLSWQPPLPPSSSSKCPFADSGPRRIRNGIKDRCHLDNLDWDKMPKIFVNARFIADEVTARLRLPLFIPP
jgi:hypothetical protein